MFYVHVCNCRLWFFTSFLPRRDTCSPVAIINIDFLSEFRQSLCSAFGWFYKCLTNCTVVALSFCKLTCPTSAYIAMTLVKSKRLFDRVDRILQPLPVQVFIIQFFLISLWRLFCFFANACHTTKNVYKLVGLCVPQTSSLFKESLLSFGVSLWRGCSFEQSFLEPCCHPWGHDISVATRSAMQKRAIFWLVFE